MTTTRVREAGGTAVLIRSTALEIPDLRVGAGRPVDPPIDIVDQWGMQSFPASDPPSNW
jgi:hypothetical protein